MGKRGVGRGFEKAKGVDCRDSCACACRRNCTEQDAGREKVGFKRLFQFLLFCFVYQHFVQFDRSRNVKRGCRVEGEPTEGGRVYTNTLEFLILIRLRL